MSRVHLPSLEGKPACGAISGTLALTLHGIEGAPLGDFRAASIGGAYHPDVTCVKCGMAMARRGFPRIRQRWMFWVSAAVSGQTPAATGGSVYMARVPALG